MSNKIYLTFGYENTDFTRNVSIANVDDSIAANAANVKTAIRSVNTSLTGGTSGGLDTFFRADDYDVTTDPTNPVGKFNGITAAKIVSETITPINLDIDTEGDSSNG